jgi:glycosyltransferase involved in cell wall biosynthesis
MKRPLRVLMVSGRLPSETEPGTLTFVKTQMESLREIGIEVEPYPIVGRKRVKYLSAISRIDALCRRGRFDIVHAHHGFSGMAARGQLRVPLVVSFMGEELLLDVDADGRPRPMARVWLRAHRILARLSAAAIVKTPEMAARLGGRNVHVIPNGVDLQLFKPMDKREARRRLGLDPDGRFILFPADPSRPEKDFPTARLAVDRLNATKPTPVRPGAVMRTPGIPPAELLVLHGVAHTRVPLFMNAADAVLLTSFYEGSPNAIKESLACERPIVSTDVGDVRSLINGLPGCVVAPRDPEIVAQSLEMALAFDGPSTGGRGRVADLSLEIVARQVLAVYERVLAGGDAR